MTCTCEDSAFPSFDRACPVHGANRAQFEALSEANAHLVADRDLWIRLFVRLEGAVAHHERDQGAFVSDADVALYAARDRILRDAAQRGGRWRLIDVAIEGDEESS